MDRRDGQTLCSEVGLQVVLCERYLHLQITPRHCCSQQVHLSMLDNPRCMSPKVQYCNVIRFVFLGPVGSSKHRCGLLLAHPTKICHGFHDSDLGCQLPPQHAESIVGCCPDPHLVYSQVVMDPHRLQW